MIDSMSDEQLLELANHYITTDESLDKFQSVNFAKNKEKLQEEKVLNMKSKIETIKKANNKDPKDHKDKYPSKEIKYVSDGSHREIEMQEDGVKKAVEYYNNLKIN